MGPIMATGNLILTLFRNIFMVLLATNDKRIRRVPQTLITLTLRPNMSTMDFAIETRSLPRIMQSFFMDNGHGMVKEDDVSQ